MYIVCVFILPTKHYSRVLYSKPHQSIAVSHYMHYTVHSNYPPMQEQERRARAESAAGAAMNGPRVEAFKYAGPDFEVSGWVGMCCTHGPGNDHRNSCTTCIHCQTITISCDLFNILFCPEC